MEITTVGLDLAKRVFQVHGNNAAGQVVLRKVLRRTQVLPFFAKLPPCLVGMEACGTSHHWATPAGAVVLLGMAGYFAGVVQAPITAFVIVMEVTDDQAMLIPLMASAVIAYGVSRLLCPEALYHALAEQYRAPSAQSTPA